MIRQKKAGDQKSQAPLRVPQRQGQPATTPLHPPSPPYTISKGAIITMNIAFFLTPKSQVAYIREGSSIRQGLEKMQRHGYTCLPVISKDGRFLGCINEGDFLWNILSMGSVTTKDMERARIDDIISDRYTPVRVTTTMEELLRHATEQNFVPVVDDRDIFMGIVTRRALLTYCLKNGMETESLPTAEYVRRES